MSLISFCIAQSKRWSLVFFFCFFVVVFLSVIKDSLLPRDWKSCDCHFSCKMATCNRQNMCENVIKIEGVKALQVRVPTPLIFDVLKFDTKNAKSYFFPFLSHLLLAGCDIGVRFSVCRCVNIYVEVRHLCQS